MADQQLTQLTAITTFNDADLLYTVINVATTPASRKITWANFQTNIGIKLGSIIAALSGKSVPADADNFIISDSASSNASRKLTWANIKTALNLLYAPLDGWITDSNTWTYSSADSPTFVASVNADMTGIINVGKRIKLTQTTVKYFIVTAVGAFSGGATLITLYGGTDYTLANASITSPYYSSAKIPFGFPADPAKWTVKVTDTGNNSQSTPTQNTWYNLGSVSITIPIGQWRVSWKALPQCNVTSGTQVLAQVTLSTANNTQSDAEWTAQAYMQGVSGALQFNASCYVQKFLLLASKTTYYLNTRTILASMAAISNRGDVGTTILEAVCAYL